MKPRPDKSEAPPRRRAPVWLGALGWLGLLAIVGIVAWAAWPLAEAEFEARRTRAGMIDAIASAASPAAMGAGVSILILSDSARADRTMKR